ncbi:hypothetical protein V3C99_009695 [Haemonchus contortus]
MLFQVFLALILLSAFTEQAAILNGKLDPHRGLINTECMDQCHLCDQHKKDGYCDSPDQINTMKIHCRKTCGFC